MKLQTKGSKPRNKFILNSLFISAAHKSSGKTIFSIGLSRLLFNLNYNLQSFKKGPDYIDMSWLSLASKTDCYNLDFNTQTKSEIKNFYDSKKSDINIIEGNKGLFDGVSEKGQDDNSALSVLLGIPILLIVDTEGITRGIAPLLQGYINFNKKCNIQGVILNKVKTDRHEGKLINAVKNYTDLKVLGSVRKSKELHISERHLGLVPANEKKYAENKINSISKIISASIDIENFKKVGFKIEKKSKKNIKDRIILNKISENKVRIGIFYDQSFGFYYKDDLEKFKAYGADLVFINSIKDKNLPKVHGLLIGGGFPEIYANRIEKNKTLIKDVKNFINAGLPVYAECGGLMYLTRSIKFKDKNFKMVGILPGKIKMSEKPIGRGYVEIETSAKHPWGLKAGLHVNAHEFHHADLIFRKKEKKQFAYKIKRGYGINGNSDGFIYKKLLANFSHLRHTSKMPWIKYFVNYVKENKND